MQDRALDRTAYLNGAFVKESEAQVSVYDRGLMFADAAFDVARTFQHRPFRLERHIARLYDSLRYLRIVPGLSPKEMQRIALQVLEANAPLLEDHDEYWITMRVTRGINPPFYSHSGWNKPTVVVYCSLIPFHTFASYYDEGMHLVTPSVRRTPPECIDPRAKTHERLNFVIGHLEVAEADPRALPLLLDLNGNVTEAFTSNVFIVSDGELLTPTTRTILSGVTREIVMDLAGDLRMPVKERDITLYDAYVADEVFLTATSFAVMPVSMVNGRQVGEMVPGPVTRKLLEAFSDLAGVSIVEQALLHLSESPEN